MSVLFVVPAAIAFAWVCGRAVHRFGQPPVIGELVAGILLGPSAFGTLPSSLAASCFNPEVRNAIGQLGSIAILVFMFVVGLELDLALLRRHATGVARIALFSLLVPFALGSVLAWSIYPSMHGVTSHRLPFILFVGTAMSITAMPVLTRILTDWRMLRTTIGTIATGCAAIDDVVAWTMLGLVAGLTGGESHPASTLVMVAGYVAVMLFGVRPALARLAGLRTTWAARVLWVVIVAAVAAASGLAADRIGIHTVFGAFVAGVCVPRSPDVLEGLNHPLRRVSVVLLPAFFILIGLRTEIALVSGPSAWLMTLAILGCASIGKLGGSALAARSAGLGWRDSLAIGVLLNTRGMVALVALDLGRSLGILSPTLFTMFVIMTLVTTLATVPLIEILGVRPARTS